jgi:flagellar L-ring protein precursor FlgH
LGALVLALSAGCAWNTPPTNVHQPMTARASASPNPTVNSGAIFQPDATVQNDSSRLRLFDDRRARYVGDTLTVIIEEKTTASKKSSGSANRSGTTDLKVPVITGAPGKIFQGAEVEAASSTAFAGKGDAASNNLFTGNLSVTVIEVLPNENLLVSGEKQITINQGTEYIRFSGVVNPVSLSAANTVSSTRVADARLEYRGTGYIGEAQTMGWLSRFFMTVWPF